METLSSRLRQADRLLVLLLPWLVCIWGGAYLLVQSQQQGGTRSMTVSHPDLPALPLRYFFLLHYPASHQSLRAEADGRATVRFRWELRATDRAWIPRQSRAALLLELSPSAAFPPERTEITRLPSPANSSLTERLLPGRYFWRMRFADSHLSEIQGFRVDPPPARSLSGESHGE